MQTSVYLKQGGWEARIEPDYGMNTLSLAWQGSAILRSPKDEAEWFSMPEAFGLPALIPASRTEDARFIFQGKEYKLPCNDPVRNCHKHGVLHKSEFTVCSRSDTAVVGVYHNKGECFPFPFDFYVDCSLRANGYRQCYTIINTGSTHMPLIFAIHAAFQEPKTLRVPIQKRLVLNERILPTGEREPLDQYEKMIKRGCTLDERKIEGCYTSCGQIAKIGDVHYHVSKNFTHWILWNGSGKDGFFCVEPQSGPVNALNRPDCRTIPPDKSIQFRTFIEKSSI